MYCVRYFFFKGRRRHGGFDCDWSSDVCSSVLSWEALWPEDIQGRGGATPAAFFLGIPLASCKTPQFLTLLEGLGHHLGAVVTYCAIVFCIISFHQRHDSCLYRRRNSHRAVSQFNTTGR